MKKLFGIISVLFLSISLFACGETKSDVDYTKLESSRKIMYLTSSGTSIYTTYFDYDNYGNIIREYVDLGGSVVIDKENEYTYDQKGNIIKKTEKLSDGEVDVYETFYNDDGKIINKVVTYNYAEGTSASYNYDYIYNEMDRVKEIKGYYLEDPTTLFSDQNISYLNGNISYETTIYPTMEEYYSVKQYQYDEESNLKIGALIYNQYGANDYSEIEYIYTYNDDDLLFEELLYSNGDVFCYVYHYYEYNEKTHKYEGEYDE